MPHTRAWSSTTGADGLRFDLEPPGFVAFYKVAAWTLIFGGAVVLPVALLGLFGALVFDDFELPLRIGMGLAGAATSAAMLWLAAKLLAGALVLRSRVTITPAGVFVETGVTQPNSVWLAPLNAVDVDKPKKDGLECGGLVLTAGDRSVRVAVGYREDDRTALLKSVHSGLKATQSGDGRQPEGRPLGPSWGARTRGLARDIVSPLRHPTPYLLVDVGAILGTSALTWLLDGVLDWRDAYPIAFAMFIAGLAARWYDGTYIAGLRHYLRENSGWSLRYVLAGVFIALAATGAMTPRLTFVPAFLVATITAIAA